MVCQLTGSAGSDIGFDVANDLRPPIVSDDLSDTVLEIPG